MSNEFNKPIDLLPEEMRRKKIDLLPEEMRRKKIPRQEKKESEIEFFVPPKFAPSKEEKKEEGSKEGHFFPFFKNIFKKKIKSQEKVEKRTGDFEKNQKKESSISDSSRPEISLMPAQTFITSGLIKQKRNNLFIIILLSFFIIFILSVLLNYFLNKKIKEVELLTSELKNIETKISATKVVLRNVKNYELIVSQAEQLLAQQPHWSNFFFLLEKYTLPEVYYEGFSADLEGKVVLPTVAKDFSTFVKQLIIFQTAKDFVKEVNFSGLNFSPAKEGESGKVSFSFELILNETVFYPQP